MSGSDAQSRPTVPPTAHLICGATGAGKTTYALRLAAEHGAVRYSIDEWMAALFWPDAPEPLTFAWALERTERCERQMLAQCGQHFALGHSVVLDLGFFTRHQRERVAAAVRAAGGTPRLDTLSVPADERWARVARRNAEQGATYALQVTRGMFDFCETPFEEPGADELAGEPVA